MQREGGGGGEGSSAQHRVETRTIMFIIACIIALPLFTAHSEQIPCASLRESKKVGWEETNRDSARGTEGESETW